jgi:hypothetical protein
MNCHMVAEWRGQERLQPQYNADYDSPSFEDGVSEN